MEAAKATKEEVTDLNLAREPGMAMCHVPTYCARLLRRNRLFSVSNNMAIVRGCDGVAGGGMQARSSLGSDVDKKSMA